MEKLAELLGTTCGLLMRVFDLLTGKRRGWFEGRKPWNKR